MIALTNAAVAQIVAAPVARVYKEGAVPANPTFPYAVVAVTFDRAAGYTLDADHGVGDYRITTRSISTNFDGAIDTDARARGALLDKRIAANGKTYGPGRLQVGSAVVRDPDGGSVITVTSTYLFATNE
jgi:hypothetical protein